MSDSSFHDHNAGSGNPPTYNNQQIEASSATTHQGGGYSQTADGQREDEFAAQLIGDTSELLPRQDRRKVNHFAVDEMHVGQMDDRQFQGSPIASQTLSQQPFSTDYEEDVSERQGPLEAHGRGDLTWGMSPGSASFDSSRPPLLRHSSRIESHGDESGGMVDAGATSSFLVAPAVPTGVSSNNASAKYTQWGFTFPNTWQEFEERGTRYFGVNGANLGSLGSSPPPETARLVTPEDPKFPASSIDSPFRNGQKVRRIAFLPNSLSLASDVLPGETIYFLRQFGVSFDDMLDRASDPGGVEWNTLGSKLRQREDAYRQKNRCGWARNFRTTRGGGRLTQDSGNKLYGPDSLKMENFIFNVWWDLDVNSQTMWSRSNASRKYPLPPPQIDHQVRRTLKSEEMVVPDLDWLSAAYPSISLPPAWNSGNRLGNPAASSGGGAQAGYNPSSSDRLNDLSSFADIPTGQATGPFRADPTHENSSLGTRMGGHFLEPSANRSQSLMPADTRPSQITHNVGNMPPLGLVRSRYNGQDVRSAPAHWTSPSYMGEGIAPGGQSQYMHNRIANTFAIPRLPAGQSTLNDRRPSASLQNMFTDPDTGYLNSQNANMRYGEVHDQYDRHSIPGSRAQSDPRGQSEDQFHGQGFGFDSIDSISNSNDRAVANGYYEGNATEATGHLVGLANEEMDAGTGSVSSHSNHYVGMRTATGPDFFVGNLPVPADPARRIHPTLSEGTWGSQVPAVGGLPGESAEEFADRFLSEHWPHEQAEIDE
ncbi:hypothetical protein FKW77_003897 [Venturia effusa]|uniref:Uncharacterized protein n=1 Tax=Venturia effusa TaxID=50376 RepID=A0A517L321_9PEZI|nr:hypothetical protein FKW77_003897 [Venturia effusa]